MKLNSPIRLRRWLPLLVLLPMVLMLSASAVLRDWQQMRDADLIVFSQMRGRLADEGLQVEYLLRTKDTSYLFEQLALFGGVSEIECLVLLDPHGKVLFANRPELVGGRAEDVLSEFNPARLHEVQVKRTHVMEFDGTRDFLLGYQPILFPVAVGSPLPENAGALLLKYNLAEGKVAPRRRVILSTVVEILLASVVVGFLTVILRRWFSRPMQELEKVLHRISEGDYVTQIEISGRGELAQLGKAISHMQARLLQSRAAREVDTKALGESEARFRVLFEQAAIGVAQIETATGRLVRVNRCYSEQIGYSIEELLNLKVEDISDPEDLKVDLANMERLVAGEIREFVMEKRLLRKDGRVLWVLLTVSAMWEPGAAPDFHIAVVQDITKRREAEQGLRESERRYSAVVSALFDGVVSQGRNGEILTWNPSAERILGLTGDELQGRTSHDPRWRTVNDDGSPLDGRDHPSMKVLRTGVAQQGVSLGVHKPDGSLRWLSVNAVPIFDSGEALPSSVVVSFEDVTDRKRAEDAVRESERFLKTIIETEPECVKIVTASGELLEMNAAGLAMLEAEDVATVSSVGLNGFILPEYREAFGALHQKVMAGESGRLEFEVIGLRGAHRWLETHAAPLRDASGRVHLLLGITRDITERKLTEAALRESLEDKEALLREVHHRVKNNLQVVVSLLRMEAARNLEPSTKFVLKDMMGRIQSMALLHELLYRSGTFAFVELSAYIKQITTHLFRAFVTKPGAVRLELEMESISLKMDQAMPCGLLVNELISNCLKHAFYDGRPGVIRIGLETLDHGRRVRLTVKDDGVGLASNFDIKTNDSLGLQLVSDLTRQLAGDLAVRNRDGAEFVVTFALSE